MGCVWRWRQALSVSLRKIKNNTIPSKLSHAFYDIMILCCVYMCEIVLYGLPDMDPALQE